MRTREWKNGMRNKGMTVKGVIQINEQWKHFLVGAKSDEWRDV